MTKAAELAKMGEVLTNSQIGGRRNLIINGSQIIAQRSTSETGVGGSTGYHTVDRFIIEAGHTAGRFTMEQVADVHDGFSYATKLSCTTADTSIGADEYTTFTQRIEGQDLQHLKKGTSDAEKVTVSFYVKGNASATYTVELRDNDNGRFNSQEFPVTTDWVKITRTFVGDTTGSFDNDNALSLKLNFWLHAGSAYTGGTHVSNTWGTTSNQRVGDNQTSFFDSTSRTFFITGIQLEVGSVATPFEHRSFGEELKLCNRYYQEFNYDRHGYYVTNGGAGSSSQSKYIYTYYGGEMRATASVSTPSVSNGYRFLGSANDNSHSTIPNIDNPSRLSVQFGNNQNTITAGTYFRLYLVASGAKIKFDAEL